MTVHLRRRDTFFWHTFSRKATSSVGEGISPREELRCSCGGRAPSVDGVLGVLGTRETRGARGTRGTREVLGVRGARGARGVRGVCGFFGGGGILEPFVADPALD